MPEDLLAIFQAASLKRVQTGSGQGQCEGDPLEKLVDCLGKTFGVTLTQMDPSLEGNTWWDVNARDILHKNLQDITDSAAYQALLPDSNGNAKVKVMPAGSALAGDAKTRFSALVALETLSPFVLQGVDDTAQSWLDGQLRSAWGTLYDQWDADTQLTDAERAAGAAHFSNDYLADRAALLTALNKAGQQNTQSPLGCPVDQATHYKQAAQNSADVREVTANGFGGGSFTGVTAKQILFGAESIGDRLVGGTLGDRLYGQGGDDTLQGGAGKDYLEGGAGRDTYDFAPGDGQDSVLDTDGAGALTYHGETLSGGAGNGQDNVWAQVLSDGSVLEYHVFDDLDDINHTRLEIRSQANPNDRITVRDFDLEAAQGSGYLGIQLKTVPRVALKSGGGANPFADPSFTLTSLTGSSSYAEGGGSAYTVYFDRGAKAGDTLKLALNGDASKFKVSIDGELVSLASAVFTLEKGQTQLSFALVEEGDTNGGLSGELAAEYTPQGGGAKGVSNANPGPKGLGRPSRTRFVPLGALSATRRRSPQHAVGTSDTSPTAWKMAA